MSSPPRCVSPLVDCTSKMPSRSFRIEISKVPPPKIVDSDGAFVGAIKTVRKRGRGGLVHQPQYFEAGHAARIFGGLALRIVEVGGHGDDGLRNRRAEKSLGIALELAQNVRRKSQEA
jgi:hypothetical protein